MNRLKNSPVIILAVSVIASFITAFMGSAINVALPAIAKEFDTTAVMLSWIATAYVLTGVSSLIPIGKLSDIYGRAKYLRIGILVFAVSCLTSGFANSAVMLLIFRAFQGIGLSFIFINSFSIIVSVYPANKRGHVLGIVISSVYVGLSIGPFLGGIITQHFGWRYIFYFSFVLCVILYFMMEFFITEEWRVSEGEKFDFKGAAIFTFAITSLMLGFSFVPRAAGFVLIISGLGMFYYYKVVSEKIEIPVLKLDIFKQNRRFTFSNIAALINYSATSAISFLLSLYLQHIKAMTPQEAGTILIAQPLFMAIFSPLAGKISDRIEPQYVSSIGMLLISICLGLLCFVGNETTLFYIVINLSVLGVGFALFSSPNSNAIMSSVEKNNYGTASTILSLMRMIGQMMSMAIVIVIFSVIIGKAEIKPENHEQLITECENCICIILITLFYRNICFVIERKDA